MRHPAAPTVVAFLLGLLAFLVLWGRIRGGGYHEGNPGPGDFPGYVPEGGEGSDGEGEDEDEEGGEEGR